jgi:hypothetical protein
MTVSSSRFYNALASKQYDELIQLYGEVAIDALQSYQNTQLRWNHRERGASRSARGTSEKIVKCQNVRNFVLV